jgi:hypothetical protein
VLAHGRALLRGVRGATVIDGDLREPARILACPVALLITLVLQFVTPAEDPGAIVARLRDELCAGSFLVLSHSRAMAETRQPSPRSAASTATPVRP